MTINVYDAYRISEVAKSASYHKFESKNLEIMWKWIIGLGVSLVIGQVVTACLLVLLRRYLERREEEFKGFSGKRKLCIYLGIGFYPPIDPSERQVPPWITGPAERLFFTLIVAYGVSGTAVAMVAWIALKMLSSRPYREQRAALEGISSALPFEFAGLLGNLASMFFALIGGLIILKI